MSQKTLTHKNLAELLGVSETTVKSYRRKFPGCIPVASKGKPIRFPENAAAVALRIRDMFELGMSVEEVRTRLAGEFSWITPESPRASAKTARSAAEPGEASPELSIGVSNMAKSMVSMSQQQKAILERMQGVETMLEELGIKGKHVDVDSLRRKAKEAAREREERLEGRLDRLDTATKDLADTVASLAEQLSRFLGQRAKVRTEWQKNGKVQMTLEGSREENAHKPEVPGSQPEVVPPQAPAAEGHGPAESPAPQEASSAPERSPARVILLRSSEGKGFSGSTAVFRENREGESAPPAEPPRQFLTLPLGIRTSQGEHVNPRGRGRGPFALNDLKAMLIYGHTPPNHFTLRWEPYGQGWWLTLEQESQNRVFSLMLMEVISQRGETVVEILQLKKNGEAVHPAEIRGIIDSLGG